MCGIFAYTGKKSALPILLDGLTALEYRGYDSAGLYVAGGDAVKSVGNVGQLRERIGKSPHKGTSGIAHTRWATHGEPTERNAHPHGDCTKRIWLAHNGIVENHHELRAELMRDAHQFTSDTDSEVIAHLIEEHLATEPFERAVPLALSMVRGTYGVVVVDTHNPEKIIVARMGSPIAIGIGEGEHFIASDASPIAAHTKKIVYLNDGEMAMVTPDTCTVMTLDARPITAIPHDIDWNIDHIQRGGYEHFMLKEIYEAPEVVANAMRGRIDPHTLRVKLGGLASVAEQLRTMKRLIIVGCGTAYYSGLVGEYLLEELAEIPVEVDIASEFRYRSAVIRPDTVVLAMSQSGETIDTLAAIREGKKKGALTLGIVNTVGSTIARETDAGIYNHAGPEIGVASTKAFMSQITVLALFALYVRQLRGVTEKSGDDFARALIELPNHIERTLRVRDRVHEVAKKYTAFENFLYIGRKYNYPIAFEGALKLKEVSYVHAEGCGAGEMKHGPIAMVDERFPTVAIALKDSVYEKMRSNIQEIKARKGPVLAIVTEGEKELASLADDIIEIPKVHEAISPVLAAIPLQLLAYDIAVLRGCNVDRPRNLAKSVTVE